VGQTEVLSLNAELKLAEGFDEGHALDIANGSSQFYNAHLWL